MSIFPIIVTVEDSKNPVLLTRLLRKLSESVAEVSNKLIDFIKNVKIPSFTEIRNSLQSNGSAPLNVTNLRGVLSDPQPASTLRYDSAPTGLVLQSIRDTQFILIKNGAGYDIATIIGGNPNTLFTLISGASGGTFMDLDTDQTVIAGANKTFTSEQFFLGGITLTTGNLLFNGTSQKIIQPITSLLVRDHADANTNVTITDAGIVTIRAGVIVTSGGVTVTAGNLLFNGTSQKIIQPTTSLLIRDHADANTNVTITDAGDVTVRNDLILTPADSRVIPGSSSFSVRDTANSVDNLRVSEAGTVTARGAVITPILQIGGGSAVSKLVLFSITISPVAVAADTTAEQTFTATGLSTSDVVTLPNKPTAQAGLGIVGARASAANTIAITFSNNTALSITPTATETYKFIAMR